MNRKKINLLSSSKTQLKGCIEVPGDKSISHRAIIISSVADGITKIHNYLDSEDVNATIAACRSMGVHIEKHNGSLIIQGNNLDRISGDDIEFNFGNSGTSMRLMMGILSAQNISSVLLGDESLNKRPMDRISKPLIKMSADIKTSNNMPPVFIKPVKKIINVDHYEEIASAQIKSSILLAGLYGDAELCVTTPPSRDHTEIMLREFNCNISNDVHAIKMIPSRLQSPGIIQVPGDLSSAAFFIVGAILAEDSEVTIKNVGLNPLRTGFIEILKMMGANISIFDLKTINGETVGSLTAKSSDLKGIEVPSNLIASSIDELPLIVLAGSQANGKTSIRNAKELRVKESDRISSMIKMMQSFTISVDEFDDGMDIFGGTINGATINSFGDHRIAMTAIIASLVSNGDIIIEDCQNIDTSFPSFIKISNSIGMNIQKHD